MGFVPLLPPRPRTPDEKLRESLPAPRTEPIVSWWVVLWLTLPAFVMGALLLADRWGWV